MHAGNNKTTTGIVGTGFQFMAFPCRLIVLNDSIWVVFCFLLRAGSAALAALAVFAVFAVYGAHAAYAAGLPMLPMTLA